MTSTSEELLANGNCYVPEYFQTHVLYDCSLFVRLRTSSFVCFWCYTSKMFSFTYLDLISNLYRVDGLRNCLDVSLPRRTAQVGPYPISPVLQFYIWMLFFLPPLMFLARLASLLLQTLKMIIVSRSGVHMTLYDVEIFLVGLQVKSHFKNMSRIAVLTVNWRTVFLKVYKSTTIELHGAKLLLGFKTQ